MTERILVLQQLQHPPALRTKVKMINMHPLGLLSLGTQIYVLLISQISQLLTLRVV